MNKMQLAVPSVQSLEAYIAYAGRIPMLSADEERRLAVRLRERNDLEAARQLVLPHLRLVIKMARGYAGYGLPQSDLIQEGNIGLLKAVKRFDPAVGRLATFAMHWIRAEIHQFVIRNWKIVKIATTKAQRKLFFKFRSTRKSPGHLGSAEAQHIAATLDVPVGEVFEMEKRIGAYDLSIHNGASDSTAGGSGVALATLPDESVPEPDVAVAGMEEQQGALMRLRVGLESLDERSRDIIRRRWLDDERKATLRELAAEYGVSAERIRQLEGAALQRLRKQLPAPEGVQAP